MRSASDYSSLQTLVISMERSHERQARVREILDATPLAWSFLPAVDGSALSLPMPAYPEKKVKRLLGFGLTRGELGVFLSHRKAWQACIDQQKVTLVFEDDFVLQPLFLEGLDCLLARYTDWQMVRLQGLGVVDYSIRYQDPSLAIVENHQDAVGLTAYLIKPPAAQQLLDHSHALYEPVDHFVEHRRKHGVTMFSILPYTVSITHEPTTIDRPERRPMQGLRKWRRSLYRSIDRYLGKDPWFPK